MATMKMGRMGSMRPADQLAQLRAENWKYLQRWYAVESLTCGSPKKLGADGMSPQSASAGATGTPVGFPLGGGKIGS